MKTTKERLEKLLLTEEEFREAVKQSNSARDVAKRLEETGRPDCRAHVRALIKELDIDTPHFLWNKNERFIGKTFGKLTITKSFSRKHRAMCT